MRMRCCFARDEASEELAKAKEAGDEEAIEKYAKRTLRVTKVRRGPLPINNTAARCVYTGCTEPRSCLVTGPALTEAASSACAGAQ